MITAVISLLAWLFGSQEAEIVFAGDAMMHSAQIEAAHRNGDIYDFSEYFQKIAPEIICADYAVVNIETPTAGKPYSGYPCFNAPAAYIDALADAGFDLFLTANNHTLDRRDRGLCATIDSLNARNLSHLGTYKIQSERDSLLPIIKEINGFKVAFLNYTYGTNGIKPGKDVRVDYIDRELIKNDIKKARQQGAEVIIPCIHWGIEYRMKPEKSQRELTEYIISCGADHIIGGHPHVIQPYEIVTDEKGMEHLVAYSLGNFISNMKTTDTRGGMILKLKLCRDENGTPRLKNVSHRLVFTEPAGNGHNFRLQWAENSKNPTAKTFLQRAEKVLTPEP